MWQLSDSWPNQFQNNLNLTWLRTSMLKSLHSLGSCAENVLLKQISSILSAIFTRLWLKCQRMFWWASCTSARHAGSFDCLMTSLILITMDNGRGQCAYWQSCKVPNQTHRGMKKIRKMYAIKQIKICAEYRDMLPRPQLDLSGTPGLRLPVLCTYLNLYNIQTRCSQYTGIPLDRLHWNSHWSSIGTPVLLCLLRTHMKTTGAISTLGCHWNHTSWCYHPVLFQWQSSINLHNWNTLEDHWKQTGNTLATNNYFSSGIPVYTGV